MNREQRKRITQNITNLKERLVDLDPIIDRLIEKDVFSLEHREKIEHVSPATPQKKFNEFIQLLLASPEPNTYFVFLEALTEERHHYMAERLQNTVISGKSCTACSYIELNIECYKMYTICMRGSTDWVGVGGSGPPPHPLKIHFF